MPQGYSRVPHSSTGGREQHRAGERLRAVAGLLDVDDRARMYVVGRRQGYPDGVAGRDKS
jgi:hypothetical protein